MTNGGTAPSSMGMLVYYTAVSLDGFITARYRVLR